MKTYMGFDKKTKRLVWTASGPVDDCPDILVREYHGEVDGMNYMLILDNDGQEQIVKMDPTSDELLAQATKMKDDYIRRATNCINIIQDQIEFGLAADVDKSEADIVALREFRAVVVAGTFLTPDEVLSLEVPAILDAFPV